eukprot:jgi/Psemu1/301105/fgenesh1_kg.26_\
MTEDQEVAWRALNDEEGDWYSAVFVLIFYRTVGSRKILTGLGTGSSKLEKSS